MATRVQRRGLLRLLLSIVGAAVMAPRPARADWRMPSELATHSCTWMAFAGDHRIWGWNLARAVEEDVARIATAIAEFEPVRMLVRPRDMARARELLGSTANVELIQRDLNDVWMRDTGPVFVLDNGGGKRAVKFNFNGWGEKVRQRHDRLVADVVAELAGVPLEVSSLVMEGGGIEVDGDGTAIIAESCVLNSNRNPGTTKLQAEEELKAQLGLQKIIWVPGIRGKDITDGHIDGFARFVRPGVVVVAYDPDPKSYEHPVTKENIDILKKAVDAQGRRLQVVILPNPATVSGGWQEDTAANYVNFYLFSDGVLVPSFGDSQADSFAAHTLQELYPEREVIMLPLNGLLHGGGGIHCVTQQEPDVVDVQAPWEVRQL